MSGLELLLIPALAPVVAPLYAYVRGRNQPDDPAEVERQRAAEAEAAALDAARTKALLQALRASDEGHRALIALWRGPFSLFSAGAQADAAAKGVPAWAIECVCEAKQLAEESSELSDLADVYEAQIAAAERDENREVLWEPVVTMTKRLIGLRTKMYLQLPRLKAARTAFDAPADASASPPPCEEVMSEPALPKRNGSSGSLVAGGSSEGSPKLRRTFTPGGGSAKFTDLEGMVLDEDGAMVEALQEKCWAVADFKIEGGGEFKWSFEVVDENYVCDAGAFYGLCCTEKDKPEWVYLHGRSGTCYKNSFSSSWEQTSAVEAGSIVHFHLDFTNGVLLGSVDQEKPVELVRDTHLFAGKVWRPGVGAQGAKPVVRLLTCTLHSSPLVIIQPSATGGIMGAAKHQTLQAANQMLKGVDRQRREKPMLKMLRDYRAWHGSKWGQPSSTVTDRAECIENT